MRAKLAVLGERRVVRGADPIGSVSMSHAKRLCHAASPSGTKTKSVHAASDGPSISHGWERARGFHHPDAHDIIAPVYHPRRGVPRLAEGFGDLRHNGLAIYAADRDLVRRWTGGGIVFHGDDLTYSIVIPASDPVFDESSIAIYEKIHRALCGAIAHNQGAELVRVANQVRTGDRGSCDNDCFANPVRADVMMDGRKIAGAAQRRIVAVCCSKADSRLR